MAEVQVPPGDPLHRPGFVLMNMGVNKTIRKKSD
jgi:hypothetical protein